ncbi:MAG TPA: hypothetical protein VFN15_05855, partial [Solirubrobacterales bacterium]|nr:hypothetical protein [Solirubrobacterales bacterium]
WDQQGTIPFPGNTENCWYGNTGRDGTAASVTSLPDKNGTPPDNLPSDCGSSPAPGAQHGQAGELLGCILAPDTCNWFTTPPEPQ